jgi:hypothetical protein
MTNYGWWQHLHSQSGSTVHDKQLDGVAPPMAVQECRMIPAHAPGLATTSYPLGKIEGL